MCADGAIALMIAVIGDEKRRRKDKKFAPSSLPFQ